MVYPDSEFSFRRATNKFIKLGKRGANTPMSKMSCTDERSKMKHRIDWGMISARMAMDAGGIQPLLTFKENNTPPKELIPVASTASHTKLPSRAYFAPSNQSSKPGIHHATTVPTRMTPAKAKRISV